MYKAARFQASSLQAMANGQVLMPYLTVLSGSKLEHLISTYKLNDLDPQAFYPQQIVCDMQKRMSEDMGLFSGELVNIGISSIDSIGFPAEIETVEDALGMLHEIYHAIHRDIPAEEGWIFRTVSDHELHIHFNSPYEPFAAYGYIYGIAHRFNPSHKEVTVYMEEDDGLALYRVEFK